MYVYLAILYEQTRSRTTFLLTAQSVYLGSENVSMDIMFVSTRSLTLHPPPPPQL